MRRPSSLTHFEQLAELPSIPSEAADLVFAEPWQATAFALTVRLSAEGQFTWSEWATALADELKTAADRGEPDEDGTHYYHHWLAALERLVIAKGLTDQSDLDVCKDAWIDAYRHSPHGQPVELIDGTLALRKS